MTELIPELRALVLAARPSLQPTAEELAGGRARLIASLGAPPGGGAGIEKAASAASGSSGLTIGVIALGLGALLAGGAIALDRGGAPPARSAAAPANQPLPAPAPLPAPTPVPEPSSRATAPVPVPVPASIAAPVATRAPAAGKGRGARPSPLRPAPAGRPTPDALPEPVTVPAPAVAGVASEPSVEPAPEPAPSTLSIELALLDAARRALRAADYPTARRLLAEHRRRFPAGQLAAERSRLTESLTSAERSNR